MNLGLVISYVVAGGIEIVFPLLVGFWLVRRFHLHWIVFGYGFIVFLLSQVLTRVPAIAGINALYGKELTATPTNTILWYAALSLTAGLFEEGGRWLGYRWFFRREPRTWANALLYGNGHAACESIILVGLPVLLAALNYVVLTSLPPQTLATLSAAQQAQVQSALQQFGTLVGWEPLLGAVERVFSLMFHLSAAVLVLQAFTRRDNRWLLLAIGWHALTDFETVMFQYTTKDPILTEGVVGLSAVISLIIILRLRPTAPEAVTAEAAPLLSLAPAEGTGEVANAGRLSFAPAGSTDPAAPPATAVSASAPVESDTRAPT